MECCWEILFNQIYSHCEFYASFRTFYVHKLRAVWFSDSILLLPQPEEIDCSERQNLHEIVTREARELSINVKSLVSHARSDYYKEQLHVKQSN